jgi:hypothetical protein
VAILPHSRLARGSETTGCPTAIATPSVVCAANTAVHTGSGHLGSGDDRGLIARTWSQPKGAFPQVSRPGLPVSVNLAGKLLPVDFLTFAGVTRIVRRGAFSPRHQNRSGGLGSFSLSEVRERAENSQLASSIVHPEPPGRHELPDFSDLSEDRTVSSGYKAVRVWPYCGVRILSRPLKLCVSLTLPHREGQVQRGFPFMHEMQKGRGIRHLYTYAAKTST